MTERKRRGVDLSDESWRAVKVGAAKEGVPLHVWLTEAINYYTNGRSTTSDPVWAKGIPTPRSYIEPELPLYSSVPGKVGPGTPTMTPGMAPRSTTRSVSMETKTGNFNTKGSRAVPKTGKR